jgi:2-dehydropantoate 2-reductase
VIKHVAGIKFGLREPSRQTTARVTELTKLFEAAGLKAPVMPEIRNDSWLKLWDNLCFNPLSALTGAILDVLATEPGTRILARNMMVEAEKIGRASACIFASMSTSDRQRGPRRGASDVDAAGS